MKKITFLFALLTALILASCSSNSYTIEGVITETTYEGKTVYLQLPDTAKSEGYNIVDSVVIADSKFTLKGSLKKEEMPALAILSVGKISEMDLMSDKAPVINLIIEPGTITTEIGENNFKIGGTPINDDYNKIYASLHKLSELGSMPDNENKETEYRAQLDTVQNVMFSFTKKNAHNKIGEHMILSSLQGRAFLPEQYLELIAATDTSFRNQPEVQQLKMMLDQVIEQQKHQKLQEERFLGKDFIDGTIMSKDGKHVKLSNYVGKGKYVLIDFWASWCRPCLQEMPYLVDVYDRYKSKGFEIVGVSTDTDLVAWHNVIDKLNLQWLHFNEPTEELAKTYNLMGIPASFLVDPSGKIIAINLRGSALQEKLYEIFTK